ncbi:MAG: hypothetical protein KDD62_16440, partial [Bdellovibrionales bacterium]|nr:hypothetical protein [Bdellovibrionales bacterium]
MSVLQIQDNRPKGLDGTEDVVVPLDDGEKITISAAEIKEFLGIAEKVSGHPNLKVMIGKPGSHAFKVMHTDCIVIDPLLIKRSAHFARFVVGHEAAHEISRSMQEIGLSREQANDLANEVGCLYIHNVIEDPAVNDYMITRAPERKADTRAVYSEMFAVENAPLVAHDAVQVAQMLGRTPRFVMYGSELIRHWHQQRYSRELDPDVRAALDKTIGKVKEIWSMIPENGSTNKSEVLNCARSRFLYVHNYVWSHVQELLELDIQDGRRVEQMKQAQQGQNGSGGQPQSGQDGKPD